MIEQPYIDTSIPQVILKKDLLSLDKNGSPCESCGKHMQEHDWALLGEGGYVIFCSVMYYSAQINKMTIQEFNAWYFNQNGQ